MLCVSGDVQPLSAMPAHSTKGLLQIEDTLQASLGKGQHKDASAISDRLISASKRILLQRVEFQPAAVSSSAQLEKLRAKYAPLNPSTTSMEQDKAKEGE